VQTRNNVLEVGCDVLLCYMLARVYDGVTAITTDDVIMHS